MIKLVVCDLDGTLLPYGDEKINQSTLEKINALISCGIRFAVSSGRTYSELLYFFPQLSEKIYFISSDGALATFQDKIIFSKPFSADALNFAFNSNAHLRFFGKQNVWCTRFDESYPDDIKVLKPFEIKEHIYKIASYGSRVANFEGVYSRIHYSDGSLSEYVPPYANKGVALGALHRHLGVSMYETLAVGDSVNDIPMMKNAKHRVAIGDKRTKLHEVCNFVSESVDYIFDKVWINGDFNI